VLDRSDHCAAPSRPELVKLCTARGHGFNQSANSDQIKASKRKQTKTKLLSFTNVYFFESSLFNWLQPSQTKKFSSVLARVSGCGRWSRALFPCSRDCAKSSLPNIIARTSIFAKKMSGKLAPRPRRRCEAERKARRRRSAWRRRRFNRISTHCGGAGRRNPLPDLSGAGVRNTSFVGYVDQIAELRTPSSWGTFGRGRESRLENKKYGPFSPIKSIHGFTKGVIE
jgi:hypothetical protein